MEGNMDSLYPIRPFFWTQIRVQAISNSQLAISQTKTRRFAAFCHGGLL